MSVQKGFTLMAFPIQWDSYLFFIFFSMKKLASRGFTLVELMIVIAIIGILAAVLYPSLMGYFESSRDTNRQAGLRNIVLALSQYQRDKSEYPEDTTKCALKDLEEKLKSYTNNFSKDPKKGFGVTGCTDQDKGGYGYARIKDTSETPNAAYVLAAKVETRGNANFDGAQWESTSLGNLKVGDGYLKNANNKGWIPGSDGSPV